jgi:hypothetical protein
LNACRLHCLYSPTLNYLSMRQHMRHVSGIRIFFFFMSISVLSRAWTISVSLTRAKCVLLVCPISVSLTRVCPISVSIDARQGWGTDQVCASIKPRPVVTPTRNPPVKCSCECEEARMYTHRLHRLAYSINRAQNSVCMFLFVCASAQTGMPVFCMQRGVSCMYRTVFDM